MRKLKITVKQLLLPGISALFITALSLFLCPPMTAQAANHVDKIDVTVSLQTDGSAQITQIWSGDFDEGSECYVPFTTNSYLDIQDLTVSMGSTVYETLDEWDVDADLDEKAEKCGLNETDDGYEICWGLTSYGNNTYKVSYNVPQVVGSYTDSDGFNFRFINSDMNTGPTDVNLIIRLADGTALDNENASIWAFGYDGQIQFEDGHIHAYTDTPIDENGNMTLMLELQKGLLSPVRSVDDSFETVKEAAFDGSDYDNAPDHTSDLIAIAVVFVIILIAVIAVLAVIIIKKIRMDRFIRETNYYRETPNQGQINATYSMGLGFGMCKEEAIIGARLLKLILQGCLHPLSDEEVSLFGRVKSSVCLQLMHAPDEQGDAFDNKLYEILEAAAGEDGVLEKKELQKYCDKKPQRLRNVLNNCKKDGEYYLNQRNCYTKTLHNSLDNLSDQGKEQLREIIGYKKFLTDFSLIAEREVTETFIWQDCLIYALLLGIADKVAAQLKNIYPQYVPEIETYERNITYAYNFHLIMYSSMIHREQELQAQRSSGSGGASSFGGGGGFSGGGMGGGTR